MGARQVLLAVVDSAKPLAAPSRAPALLDLIRLSLSAIKPAEAEAGVRRAAEVLFDSIRVGTQLTPLGDAMEDQLGHAGHYARSGRRLLWMAERTLERDWGVALWGSQARTLAIMLSRGYGSEGIIVADDLRLEKVVRAIERKLKRWPPASEATPRERDQLRQEVAIDVVCAAARASGFRNPKRRLFDWLRKTRARPIEIPGNVGP
jgi:hypothetical protein